LLKAGRPRLKHEMGRRERLVELAVGLTFLCAAGALALAYPPGSLPLGETIALAAAYALCSRVEYRAGIGHTAPTQLVLVPMLLLLPPAVVPLLVALVHLLERLPGFLSGERHPERAAVALGDSWYAIGPAAVLAIGSAGGPDWSDWPLYLLAFGAQCLFDLASSAIRNWGAQDPPLRNQGRVFASIYAFDAILSPIGLLAAFAAAGQPYAFLLVLPFALVFAAFTRERDARIDEALELSRAYKGTARLLADVLEGASGHTAAHSRDVVCMALAVADDLGLGPDECQEVEFTALLHDIGKLAMPPGILEKPGPLNDDEWALMKTHTVEGEQLLLQVGGVLGRVGRAVRASHERWDGEGYPDGLTGEQIPLAARIVACCDAFDAMTTDRCYRSAMPLEEAVAELRAGAGAQFDPRIAELTARVAERTNKPRRTEPEAEEIAAVAEATRELAGATDREAAHRAVCAAAVRLAGADAAVLLEPDPEGVHGHSPEAAHAFLAEVGASCAHFEPVVRNGALLAVLAVASRDGDTPPPARKRLRMLAVEAAIALERTDLVARLRAAVRTDELTGLLKRGAWEEELRREFSRSARDGRPLCVAMLDLDHFKAYNDSHGHPEGDEALRECAAAWRAELRLTDFLGRYGGDEFMVLLPSCSLDSAEQLVERLTLATPAGLSCSAGVAEWNGSETPAELVKRADEALFAAKGSGRRQVSAAL
jgi:diguanylate cyclase (GGDEF)-like protein